jgi:hypothetical protein
VKTPLQASLPRDPGAWYLATFCVNIIKRIGYALCRCMVRDVAVLVQQPEDFLADAIFPSHIVVPRCQGPTGLNSQHFFQHSFGTNQEICRIHLINFLIIFLPRPLYHHHDKQPGLFTVTDEKQLEIAEQSRKYFYRRVLPTIPSC